MASLDMYRSAFVVLCFVALTSAQAQITVRQLITGQIQQNRLGAYRLIASVTLVHTPQMNMLIDTAAPTDFATRNQIMQSLYNYGLSPQQINVIVVTHGHADHYGQVQQFQNAKLITSFYEVQGNVFVPNTLNATQIEAVELLQNIEIWKLRGHTADSIGVVLRNVPRLGTVAVAGDLFYSSLDATALRQVWTRNAEVAQEGQWNRRKVLCNANWIVPGHGEAFQVTQAMLNYAQCQGVARVNVARRATPFQIPQITPNNNNNGYNGNNNGYNGNNNGYNGNNNGYNGNTNNGYNGNNNNINGGYNGQYGSSNGGWSSSNNGQWGNTGQGAYGNNWQYGGQYPYQNFKNVGGQYKPKSTTFNELGGLQKPIARG